MRRCLGLVLLLVGMLAGSASAQSALINGDRVLVGTLNFCDAAGSTGDAYVCSLTPALTTYIPGAHYFFKASADNVGAATLDLNVIGAKTIVKMMGSISATLADNDIRAGQFVEVIYDGTNMQMVSQLGGAGDFSSNTATSVDSELVVFSGTGGKTGKRATGTGLATLTSGVLGTVTAPTGAVVGAGQANTWTTGAQDMGSATSLKVPTSAGAAPTANGLVAYDSTSNTWEGGVNGSNAIFQTSLTNQVRSIFIPAGGMDIEGACTANATAVLVTTGPKLPTITCTDADADGIDFDWVMPDSWNAGTITIELNAFSIGNNNAEVLEMRFSGQCVRDNDAVAAWSITSGSSATSGSNVAASITWGNAANREQHATTAALTLGGTCAAGAHVYAHGYVNATNTTMTPMTDLKILGAKIEYTRSGDD